MCLTIREKEREKAVLLLIPDYISIEEELSKKQM